MPRRRGQELDAAIRDAVLDLLARHGPVGVTMEAVAAAAATSKTVLYRRWPDATVLLRDTLLGIATDAIPHEDTGSYRGDMLAVLRGWAALFTGPRAPVIRAAIAAGARDPDLTEAFRNGVIGWRKQEMAALLARGITRGDVRADVPVELARELGQSVLWHRLLITGDRIDDDLVVQLVDEVLVPFVAPR
ncbi:TetR family transcriptional regulator [Mycolicibacterium acapulense]|uniref:TetR family transcriptional regulator n=1 Tax=Mycobacterium lehmannii TaxID=2048550 RepID=A0A117JKI7_9MYCO|nr:TetR-like C-terminal domain-containing protein [Mycobacterium lehmannii]KUH94130.1 TetR family transcriptional regulator [Mycolicibacterium acapulense]KUH97583.1 TetR family transcriptional regulator [Mycolicibacterium acapulense]KUI07477.1 TetR family transcriptional regulator [Mycolicibacterium acapulense]KUI17901.1 TetR family transcriptional regulator [Mycobacterium lehmannii]